MIHYQTQGRTQVGTFIGALSLVIALCGVGLAGLAGPRAATAQAAGTSAARPVAVSDDRDSARPTASRTFAASEARLADALPNDTPPTNDTAPSLLLLSQTITATYIGPATGIYNDPANWDIGVVPINDVANTFNVVILPSVTLDFGIPGTSNITGLSLGANSTIRFIAGESLQVDGVSIIEGIVDVSGVGSAFISLSQFAAFSGDRPRVLVAGGANASIAAPSYIFTALFGNITVLSSDGIGSFLNLSALTSVNGAFSTSGTVFTHSIAGTNSGTIDMSNVQTVTGANGNDWLRFLIDTGGDINLASLTQTSARVWFDVAVATYTLPVLQNTANRARLDVAVGSTLTLPALTTFNFSEMLIADGGTINAPVLTDFSGSTLDLNPNRAFNSSLFTNIDESFITVRAGSVLGLAATGYIFNQLFGNVTLLQADGAGSRLNFGSLQSINGAFSTSGTVFTHSISATNSGVVDLSSVGAVTGANGNDWLEFLLDTGGDIDLSSLTDVTGRTKFSSNVPLYALPALSTAAPIWLNLSIGTEFDTPSLTAISGTGSMLTVPVFALLDLPILTSMNGTTVDLQEGGRINAPNLTSFTNSSITLSPPRFLVAPLFTNIDESFITVNGGSTLGLAATGYVFNQLFGNVTLLQADGAGSRLNFGSLQSINGAFSTSGTVFTHSISATNSGVVDLSSVVMVAGANGNDWLRFNADSDGLIVFGNVTTVSGRNKFEVTGTTPLLDFKGLVLTAPSQIIATLGGTVRISGDYSFTNTAETDISLGGGILHMNGQVIQRMEVGGLDIGIPTGPVTNNFEIGQLIVGDFGQPTTVELTDLIDNGNRGAMGEGESLYLQGFPQGEGALRIRGGSILVIGNLNVYATDATQQWFRVNDLFPVGVNTIPFDGGFIALTPDCNSNMIPDSDDVNPLDPDGNGLVSLDCNGNGVPDECEPDCNANGVVDACDVDPLDPDGNGLVSSDCDGNGIPDECEADCNANGVVDACDVDPTDPDGNGLVSADCDGNGVPDECDPDCNANGIPDACEAFTDCNVNGVPDTCELAGNDCNANLIPDDCDTDCNNNGIPDDCEIITDCNLDGIPDECQLPFNDCNGNLIPDDCELVGNDCNANLIPDDCELVGNDCNANLIPDDCELVGNDCNLNGVPDQCDLDCNVNGIPDQCDITAGTSLDCNTNGVPDECDISSGTSTDCQPDGVPDDCQVVTTGNSVLSENFDDITLLAASGWVMTNNSQPIGLNGWFQGNPAVFSALTGSTNSYIAANFNNAGTPSPATISNWLITPEVTLQTGMRLSFFTRQNGTPQVPSPFPDRLEVRMSLAGVSTNVGATAASVGDFTTRLLEINPTLAVGGYPAAWTQFQVVISGIAVPTNGRLAFRYFVTDGGPNGANSDFIGIDNLQFSLPAQDCNANGVPDECELVGNDCNANGVLDACDIAAGTSIDCDGNGIPDECETITDCNGNGVSDACDIFAGTSTDFNGDGVPDECQVVNLTQGTAHATIAGAIAAAADGDNLLAAAGLFGSEPVIDYANKAVRLASSGPVGQPVGGSLTMANGGRLSAAAAQGITLGGGLTVPLISDVELFGTPVTVDLTGSMLVALAARAVVNGALVNSGTVTVQGGSLAANTLQNNVGATLTAFGDLAGAITNDGDVVTVADAQIVGNYLNNGTTTVQNGVLTIIGTLTNNGTIIGNVAGGTGALGLTVLGDSTIGATAQLLMPGAGQSVKVDGNLDIAINDNTRFDMASAEFGMIGLGAATQTLELMSEDIGADHTGFDRTLPGHYPIGTLRIGPTPTTVQLVDNRDNDNLGQTACEALYVQNLIIDAGATLTTGACRIYYQTLVNNGTVDNPANLVPTFALGDMNCDSAVDLLDISPFATALTDAAAYAAAFPGCDINNGDMNSDSVVNGVDVQGFVDNLLAQ